MLTKSTYVMGLSCQKALWYYYHDKSALPEPSDADKHRMSQGILVGEMAQDIYPEGVMIGRAVNRIDKTKELLASKIIIFEAGIVYGKCYARPDILIPVGDEWDIIEVKSSTKVKEEHIQDVAFQKYVYSGFGLKIRKCFLMHIDNSYVKDGSLELVKFFAKEDVTDRVEDVLPDVPILVEELVKVMESTIEPGRCARPKDCGADCWDFLPEHNVFELTNGRKSTLELYEQGVLSLKDVPDTFLLKPNQRIQVNAVKSGETHIDKEAIQEFLSKLKYPLYFMDFEAFNTAVPLFDGTKPYQQIVFQYSVHVQDSPDSELRHESFISPVDSDPRKPFIESLKDALGGEGSILVYFQTYEKLRLKECLEAFPENTWIPNVLNRIVDLYTPFKEFRYYHPEQHGRASIKNVLPALTDMSYKDLEINNGDMASTEYLRVRGKVSEEERAKVLKALDIYCEQDTLAMVKILQVLE